MEDTADVSAGAAAPPELLCSQGSLSHVPGLCVCTCSWFPMFAQCSCSCALPDSLCQGHPHYPAPCQTPIHPLMPSAFSPRKPCLTPPRQGPAPYSRGPPASIPPSSLALTLWGWEYLGLVLLFDWQWRLVGGIFRTEVFHGPRITGLGPCTEWRQP